MITEKGVPLVQRQLEKPWTSKQHSVPAWTNCVGASIHVLYVFLCYHLDLSLCLYRPFCIYKCNPPDRICVLSLYNDRAVVWVWGSDQHCARSPRSLSSITTGHVMRFRDGGGGEALEENRISSKPVVWLALMNSWLCYNVPSRQCHSSRWLQNGGSPKLAAGV